MAKDYKDTSSVERGMGNTHGAGVMFMSVHVGEAKSGNSKYTMLVGVGASQPMVVSEKTGKTFAFSWSKLIEHAIEVGLIDEQ